jgi:hypothetical protein
MKNALVLNSLIVGLFSSMLVGSFASAGEVLKVVSGGCRFETSGEIIPLVNVDPYKRFGLFSVGSSKEGDQIQLDQSEFGAVTIMLGSGDSASRTVVELSPTGPTSVRTGLTVKHAGAIEADFLSCDLKVK